MTTKKCPFIKLFMLCFPMLNKKPTKEQNEIIELINEGIDQIQEAFENQIKEVQEESQKESKQEQKSEQ